MNKDFRDQKKLDSERALILLESALAGNDVRICLSELYQMARRKHVSMSINLHPARARLPLLLRDEDPKTRRNAARLLGELGVKNDAVHIRATLAAEQTLFCMPSMILALGALGDKAGVEEFAKRLPQLQDQEPKHVDEIRDAVNAVLQVPQRSEFYGFQAPVNFELTSPAYADILQKEAERKGFAGKLQCDSLTIETQDYPSLFSIRSFEEALIPLGSTVTLPVSPSKSMLTTWAANAAQAAVRFVPLIEEALGKGAAFRIELRGVPHNHRAFITHEIAKRLCSESYLINSVSDYSAELRINVLQAVSLIFAKLYVPGDPRFNYRLGSVPASISPNIAAAIMQFAQPFFKEGAVVLDPCCGSGTMLIERSLAGPPCASLTGLDVSGEALSIARKNTQAAGVSASYVGGDMLSFTHKHKYNEIIANLPFGNRSGIGGDIAGLYSRFFARLDDMLHPGGTVLLYTTQHMALLRIAANNGYKVAAQHRFEAGGLLPYAVVFKKEQV